MTTRLESPVRRSEDIKFLTGLALIILGVGWMGHGAAEWSPLYCLMGAVLLIVGANFWDTDLGLKLTQKSLRLWRGSKGK